MKNTNLYGLFVFALLCVGGLLPNQVQAADITVTCDTTCTPTYSNYTGTVTLALVCSENSPASFTGRLTVNGVSTPTHTQTCPVPTVSFTASPAQVNSGEQAFLTWTVSDATSCTASGASDWSGPVAFSGTNRQPVSPSANTTYTLDCVGAIGSTVRQTSVRVPSGYISGSTCQIPVGGSTCASFITWSTADFFGSVLIAQGSEEDPDVYPASGVLERDVSINDRTFTLRDQGGTFVDTEVVVVTCADGGIWSEGSCLPAPEIRFEALQDTIRSGNTANLDIEITSGFDLSCTISGGIDETFTHPGSDLIGVVPTQNYDQVTRPLTSAQIVRIECTSLTNPDIRAEDEVRINVIPTIQEV